MQRIGRYEVLNEVARGGMGVVYRAFDPVSDRQVAVKVLIDPEPDPRFRQEARALAQLTHQGIVVCHDLFQDEHGRDVLVMQWVEGESLKQRLERQGPLPVGEALDLTRQLCEALGYAHGRGVIHRDVKPHNVLVTRQDQVKLTDFGLGKRFDRALERSRASLTASGEIMGTPAYMPPEQAEGNKAAMGPRSDVYGVGATLYALLTGKPPFQGATTINVLHAVVERPADPPSARRRELPPALDALVLRCLAKRPDERFESMGTLIAALQALATQEARDARSPVTPPSRRPAWAAAGVVGLGVLAAGALVLLRWPAAPAPAEAASPTTKPTPKPTPKPTTGPTTALRELLGRGYAHLERHGWRDAVVVGTEAITLAPEQAGGWILRAKGYLGLGDLARARLDAEQALRLDPQNPAAWGVRGAIRAIHREYTGALADYDRALELDPDEPEWFFQRGVVRASHEDLAGALEDYDRAVKLLPDRFDYQLRRATAVERLHGSERAVPAYERAIELDPGNSSAHMYLASALAELDPERAMTEYDLALALDPQNGVAYAGRAKLHALAARDRDALHNYDQAAARLPNNPALLEERALVRRRVGDLAGAIEDLERVVHLRPTPEVTALLRELRGQARVGPDEVIALVLEAAALGRAQRYPEALQVLNRAVALGPERPLPYLYRAQTFDKLDDVPAAFEDCDRALALSAGLPADKLAQTYTLRGRLRLRLRLRGRRAPPEAFDAAVADFTRAIELAPSLCLAYRLRGTTLLAQGRPAPAVEDLTAALAGPDPLAPAERFLILEQRGTAHDLLGDVRAAVADWEQALEIDPRASLRERLASARRGLEEAREPTSPRDQ